MLSIEAMSTSTLCWDLPWTVGRRQCSSLHDLRSGTYASAHPAVHVTLPQYSGQ
jgi:hypothetical protein